MSSSLLITIFIYKKQKCTGLEKCGKLIELEAVTLVTRCML